MSSHDQLQVLMVFLRSSIPISNWPAEVKETLIQTIQPQREVGEIQWRQQLLGQGDMANRMLLGLLSARSTENIAQPTLSSTTTTGNLAMSTHDDAMSQLLRRQLLQEVSGFANQRPLGLGLHVQSVDPSNLQLLSALGFATNLDSQSLGASIHLLQQARERALQLERLNTLVQGRSASNRLDLSLLELSGHLPQLQGPWAAQSRPTRLGLSDADGNARSVEGCHHAAWQPPAHDQPEAQREDLDARQEGERSDAAVAQVPLAAAIPSAAAPSGRLPECDHSDSFPIRIYRMIVDVEAAGLSHIVSFTFTGRAFKIHKPEEFMRDVASQYFQYKHYPSFKRQLNLYGFARIPRGPEEGAYTHRNFCRGRPDLACLIQKVSDDPDARKEWKPEFNFLGRDQGKYS